MGIRLGIGIPSSGGGGGEPATGPASWDPEFIWTDPSANTSIDIDVEHWTDTHANARWSQTTDSRQPDLLTAVSDINGKDALDFVAANSDRMSLNSSDVSLANQAFWFDGSTSWRMEWVLRVDSASTTAEIFTVSTSDGGFEFKAIPANEQLQTRLWGTGGYASGAVATGANGSAPNDIWHLVSLEFDASAAELKLRMNGGPWTTVSTSGITHSSNAASSAADLVGSGVSNCDCKVSEVFVTKTIPSAARDAEILDYYLGQTNSGETNTADGWVAQWPSEVDAAYDPTDSSTVTTSGGNVTQLDDVTGQGNHQTDTLAGENPPAYDSTTYGVAVLVYDTANDEALELPSAWSNAMNGGTDLPGGCALGLRIASDAQEDIVFAGEDGSDHSLRLRTLNSGRVQAFRRDSAAGSLDNLASATSQYPLNTWATMTLNIPGDTVELYTGTESNPNATGAFSGTVNAANHGKFGSNHVAGGNNYDGAAGRQVYWSGAALYGMKLAKVQRWTHWATDNV